MNDASEKSHFGLFEYPVSECHCKFEAKNNGEKYPSSLAMTKLLIFLKF